MVFHLINVMASQFILNVGLGVRDNDGTFLGNHLMSLKLVGVRGMNLRFGGKRG